MSKTILITGILCVIVASVFGVLAVYNLFEIQRAIEYQRTLPLGSSWPFITYESFWQRLAISIVLFISGGILLIKNVSKRFV
jgi:hypothetical protein